MITLFNIPLEFWIFGAMLGGIALFHRRSFPIAVLGLGLLLAYKLAFTDLTLLPHLSHELRLLINLAGLLLGFAVLAKIFEESGLPKALPAWLPGGAWGGFTLLCLVALLSALLDNIAAAVIGTVMAQRLYHGRVSTGYLAGIVASANAGGAGSVIGDTTTTMMWIAGVPALTFVPAFLGAVCAVSFVGFFASRAQQRTAPFQRASRAPLEIDGVRLAFVVVMMVSMVISNVLFDLPAAGLWVALLAGSLLRPVPWRELRRTSKGMFFLLALVLAASFMPVQSLPDPSWQTTFALGWVSAVFDNIPLTALAIFQGGYDWALLAFAVGYGGSMVWFGSSAGIAVSSYFPRIRHTGRWLKEGWFVPAGYILGFFVMLVIFGWHPGPQVTR